jgi:hypothetical protein
MLNPRKMRIALAVIALSAMPGAFAAQDTQQLAVAASISALCKLTLSTGGLNFGALDPTLTTDATASATASYQCTKGTAVTATGFTVGGSSSGAYSGSLVSGTTTDTIPFAVAWTQPGAFSGMGFSSSATKISVSLGGTIVNADYVNKTPANYAVNIPVVVNY